MLFPVNIASKKAKLDAKIEKLTKELAEAKKERAELDEKEQA